MSTRPFLKTAFALWLTVMAGSPFAFAQFIPAEFIRPSPRNVSTEVARDAIREAFDTDPRVPSQQIAIVVAADQVTLFGTLPDEESVAAALRVALAAARPRPVENNMEIAARVEPTTNAGAPTEQAEQVAATLPTR